MLTPRSDDNATRVFSFDNTQPLQFVKGVTDRRTANVETLGNIALHKPLTLVNQAFAYGIQYTKFDPLGEVPVVWLFDCLSHVLPLYGRFVDDS